MGAQELAHSRKHTLTVRVVRIVIVTRQLQHAMRRGEMGQMMPADGGCVPGLGRTHQEERLVHGLRGRIVRGLAAHVVM